MPAMRQEVIETEPYKELAEHLPTGVSYRELARQLGRSREYWRARCSRDADQLVEAVEGHLRAGRRPLFEIPFGPLQNLAASLNLAQYATDQLRARGWHVIARSIRYAGLNGVAFEIVFVEQEEQP